MKLQLRSFTAQPELSRMLLGWGQGGVPPAAALCPGTEPWWCCSLRKKPAGRSVAVECPTNNTSERGAVFPPAPLVPLPSRPLMLPNSFSLLLQTTSSALKGAIQLGITHTVGSLSTKPERDVLMQDFYVVESIFFPRSVLAFFLPVVLWQR